MRSVLALVAAVALVGCGSGQEAAVEGAARSFDEALRSGDLDRACSALAPSTRQELEDTAGQPCPQALRAQELVGLDRVAGVQRYGRQASVAVRSTDGRTDTWFLSRFGGRWLLVAAACQPRAPLPHDCGVEGP